MQFLQRGVKIFPSSMITTNDHVIHDVIILCTGDSWIRAHHSRPPRLDAEFTMHLCPTGRIFKPKQVHRQLRKVVHGSALPSFYIKLLYQHRRLIPKRNKEVPANRAIYSLPTSYYSCTILFYINYNYLY